MWVLFDALLSVYGSARKVEAELSHPIIWNHLRHLITTRFPNDPDQWLPERPMRRYHYLYGRTRYLTDPTVLAELGDIHRTHAANQARQLGLMSPDGRISWTHPDLDRMLYADGKVITPLFRARPGDTKLDKSTGELRPVRAEPDGGLHFEGTGDTAWGTKWVIVAARTKHRHGRIILDVDWVPTPGGEATTAMGCFDRLRPLLDGAQGVIYDTALRGVHHQHLLRDLGWLPVNRVTAAKASVKTPRRKGGERVEKSTFIEDRTITLQYRSPLARRQAQLEAQGALSWLDIARQLGPEAAATLDGPKAARWAATMLDLPASLLRPDVSLADSPSTDAPPLEPAAVSPASLDAETIPSTKG